MRGIQLVLICALAITLAPELWAEEAERILRFGIEIEDSGVEPVVHEKGAVILGPGAVRVDSEVDEFGKPSSSLIYQRADKTYLILFHETEEAVTYDLDEVREFTKKNDALQDKLWERLTMGRSPEEAEAMLNLREARQETARLENVVQRAGLKLEKTGETGELNGHPWIKYEEFRSGSLAREFLVTPWEHLEIGEETSKVFDETAYFAGQRNEISGGRDRAPDPFQHYEEFAGFPIVVRQFDGEGNVVYESKVTTIEVIEASETPFQNPGYAQEGLADRVREIE